MFGCGSDMELIYYQYGVKLKSVFDLQVCAEVLNLPFQGLDKIINEVLHIEIKNKKMYQMFNWTARPIRKDALEYALGDVKYLFQLYAYFMEEIKKRDLCDALIEKMVRSEFDYEKERKPKLLTSKEYMALSRDKKDRFNVLFEAREALAKKFNLPPNLVIANPDLFVLTGNSRYISKLPFCNKIDEKMKREIVEVFSKLG
jgi:ribonuclease D